MKVIIAFLLVIFSILLNAQNKPIQNYESSYLFQGKYPTALKNKDWFPDDHEVQGVTNDGENWFFTIVDQVGLFADANTGFLWRIPKTIPLDGNVLGNSGVIKISSEDSELTELKNLDAWHYGDPDHYKYKGIDYILVPVNKPKQLIICFRADNLAYVNFGFLDSAVSPGWCAVGVDSALYTSANNVGVISKYEVDWDKLISTKEHQGIFNFSESYSVTNPDGSIVFLTDMQGGEFTLSGEMLYLVSGRGKCAGNGAAWSPRDGIHAIETQNWIQVNESYIGLGEKNYFSYDYNSSCVCLRLFGTETPEGLTFWDLEDGSAPNINGSLHVLVDRYIWESLCNDELKFYHYSTNIHVDKNAIDTEGLLGRRNNPFKKVNDAYNYYPIWNGAKILIKAGEYDDTGIYSTRIQMLSEGGVAIIGKKN